jgi:hypothetical protein
MGESVRRACVGLLVACAAVLGLSGSAGATPLAYTFDASNEGWRQNQNPADLTTLEAAGFQAIGGNPGGHLIAEDWGGESGCPDANPCQLLTFYSPIVTPLTANYDGLASFDLRTSANPDWIDSAAEVWLLAAGPNYLDGFLPSPTGTDYNHFSIPLNELANWRICPYGGAPICPRPDQAQFKALIGATDQIAVMADIANPGIAGIGETYELDNVTLTEGAPIPVTPAAHKKKCKKNRRRAPAKTAKRKCKKKRPAKRAALKG